MGILIAVAGYSADVFLNKGFFTLTQVYSLCVNNYISLGRGTYNVNYATLKNRYENCMYPVL